ncbi:hypothetical protein [Pseudoalteromonas sp. NBT06-2]|uniref:hypothetical protein n=1 Tax=Pseudoalteromonas sp. NBT06-2 TaxID=2025950 RepID=UPI002074CC23|nr:hypothetical protein [Pseudoalteromonas sp. NBT06-2]
MALIACGTQEVQNKNNTQTEVKNATSKIAAIQYPETKKSDVVDNYFETQVADPYRWLEDDMSEETADWVRAQNKVTADYLPQIPYRDELKASLKNLMDYEKVGAPFKEGNYIHTFIKMMVYKINMLFIAKKVKAKLKFS